MANWGVWVWFVWNPALYRDFRNVLLSIDRPTKMTRLGLNSMRFSSRTPNYLFDVCSGRFQVNTQTTVVRELNLIEFKPRRVKIWQKGRSDVTIVSETDAPHGVDAAKTTRNAAHPVLGITNLVKEFNNWRADYLPLAPRHTRSSRRLTSWGGERPSTRTTRTKPTRHQPQ